MQKVWRQIGLTMSELAYLHGIMEENGLKNESQAVSEVLIQVKRFRLIVNSLEKQAHNQQIKKKEVKTSNTTIQDTSKENCKPV